jgi:crotonobetainyl-CoA:carnitine CoA-transferase CaiB-like acyl-CoA transferase
VEDGVTGADELTRPEWSTLQHRQRPDAIERFGILFGKFAGQRTRLELYREAQGRGIALSPVNDIAAVLEDPQLAARKFFVTVDDPQLGRTLTYPGQPYRLSATPASRARPAPQPGADSETIIRDELRVPETEVRSLRRAGAV